MSSVRPPPTIEPNFVLDLLSSAADAHIRTKELLADLNNDMLPRVSHRNLFPPLWVL